MQRSAKDDLKGLNSRPFDVPGEAFEVRRPVDVDNVFSIRLFLKDVILPEETPRLFFGGYDLEWFIEREPRVGQRFHAKAILFPCELQGGKMANTWFITIEPTQYGAEPVMRVQARLR